MNISAHTTLKCVSCYQGDRKHRGNTAVGGKKTSFSSKQEYEPQRCSSLRYVCSATWWFNENQTRDQRHVRFVLMIPSDVWSAVCAKGWLSFFSSFLGFCRSECVESFFISPLRWWVCCFRSLFLSSWWWEALLSLSPTIRLRTDLIPLVEKCSYHRYSEY